MTGKKLVGWIHRWLGLTSGLVIFFLGITGCILAFEKEICDFTQPYRYTEVKGQEVLPPSDLKKIASLQLPGKIAHSVLYSGGGRSAQVIFYNDGPDYYYLVFIDQFNGKVLKVKNMNRDFFRFIVNGHYNLWLPRSIGQVIVASATLVFVFMMISGVILWWPKNKAARKQRFNIKWSARWRRVNYDIHNVLGFYMSWIAMFIAITGLIMGFQWFAKSFYWTISGGADEKAYYEPLSAKNDSAKAEKIPPVDRVYQKMRSDYPTAQTIEVHFPESDSSAIAAGANPDACTYWQTDYRYFDQYSLKELPVTHIYGRYKDAGITDKIARMNYDLHVGAVLGLTGKILAFFASLIAASLPITGFLMWRGRKKKVTRITN